MGSEMLNPPAELQHRLPGTLQLPAPTAWPIILAFGLALVFAGLVTSLSVSLLGVILAVTGCIGWVREVLPHWSASMGLSAHCERHSLASFLTRWTSLWCDVANVSAPPNSAWRLDRAHRVV